MDLTLQFAELLSAGLLKDVPFCFSLSLAYIHIFIYNYGPLPCWLDPQFVGGLSVREGHTKDRDPIPHFQKAAPAVRDAAWGASSIFLLKGGEWASAGFLACARLDQKSARAKVCSGGSLCGAKDHLPRCGWEKRAGCSCQIWQFMRLCRAVNSLYLVQGETVGGPLSLQTPAEPRNSWGQECWFACLCDCLSVSKRLF